MRIPQLIHKTLISAAIGVNVVACDSGPRFPVGSWALETVAGQSLPVTVSVGTNQSMTIYSDVVEFHEDGTYVITGARASVSVPRPEPSLRASGTWSASADAVTLLLGTDGPPHMVLTIEGGGSLTENPGFGLHIYRRR